METRGRRAFLALIIAQAAHSVEEYLFRLYEVFPPARLVSGLIDDNLARGFAIANAVIVLFGFWCYFARVRKGGESGRGLAWFWTSLETINGTNHLVLALARGGYFPGAGTAPILLACSAWLGSTLLRNGRTSSTPSGP